MRRVILVSKVTGQLGNRLQVHAHLMATAIEHDALLVNPCLAAYARHFAGTVGNPWGRHDRPQARPPAWMAPAMATATRGLAYAAALVAWQVAKPPVMRRLGLRALRARNDGFIDLEAAYPPGCWGLLATRGLHFYAPHWVERHAAAIRAFFTPLEPWRGNAERRAAAARGGADLLIGVHIRHGDYAQHHGGRWFFPIAAYAGLMRGLAERAAPRRVRFLVCSNAALAPADFPGLAATIGTGHLIEDLHALACCDLIVGPPSSYSGWAAFWGGARLHFIDDPAAIPDPNLVPVARVPDGGGHSADRGTATPVRAPG